MTAIPVEFRRGGEGAVASYDYQDIADGTGFKILYPGDASGANILTTNAFYSLKGYTRTTGASITTEFDLLFNRPANIRGNAMISVPLAMDNNGGSSHTSSQSGAYIDIYHVDGAGAESFIASGSNVFFYPDTAIGAAAYTMQSAIISLTRKHFKKGEAIRLKLTTPIAFSSSHPITMGHDPKARTDLGEDSLAWPHGAIAEFHLPFELDL